ncbi:Protein PHLOEM PROTEIN 2-LIKE A10 [Cardamine amara subsp. amara]|uniref:Protein PHLOEM PROTEIN 2-LIKE A10 n=1 Tax=Cardamine amara subsp. amara TaxID=228776 RepID=A0ABD0ZWJ6_CARAN
MDLGLSKKGLNFALRNKKWILLAVSGYGAFRVYHSPSISQKRKQISKLFTLLFNLIEAASDSAEAISIVTKDLTEFLRSDSDQIPNSLKQISKIAKSDELNSTLIRFTEAMTIGVIKGLDSGNDQPGSGFTNRVMDKLFTKSGSGFASAIVGSFARNLVVAFYSSSSSGESPIFFNSKLLDAICSDDGRKLIGDCVQRFVSTAVSVYLDKTSDVNVFDDLFSGLTNPKHEEKVKETLVTICNNAVETFVKASSRPVRSSLCQDSSTLTVGSLKPTTTMTWIDRVSSSLSVPSNRKYVVDLTGRVTFETVRSLLEVLIERANGKVESYVEKVIERGNETKRFVRVKSSLLHSLCLSLCLQIVEAPWILTPRN